MQQYLDLLTRIKTTGKRHENRTGEDTLRVWGAEIRHDLAQGFPLLTTKKMAYKAAFVELLGFVRGMTHIRWYQERGCNIWNADHARWHGPDLKRDKARMLEIQAKYKITRNPIYTSHAVDGAFDEDEISEEQKLHDSIAYRERFPHSLGEVYGSQWRNLNGYDQLAEIVKALRAGSNSRRLVMSAWNPARFHMMCLPPCHIEYHFCLDDGRLNIACHQRSCDTPLGVPFNIANTALLAYLVAHAAGVALGEMVWYGDDVHIYENQLEGVEEQLAREPLPLPELRITKPVGTDPWDVDFEDIRVIDYESHPSIKFKLSVG